MVEPYWVARGIAEVSTMARVFLLFSAASNRV